MDDQFEVVHHPVVIAHAKSRSAAKADHDFVAQEKELRSNTELTRAIHALTTDIHRHVVPDDGGR